MKPSSAELDLPNRSQFVATPGFPEKGCFSTQKKKTNPKPKEVHRKI